MIEHPNIPQYPADGDNVKLAAGWLIEKAGWKGRRKGNVGVHEKQALILVNYGGATGNEIVDLSKEVQAAVLEKFGVELQPEVTIV
jgi:UDP-N-acetylmuramate dehydrogenase